MNFSNFLDYKFEQEKALKKRFIEVYGSLEYKNGPYIVLFKGHSASRLIERHGEVHPNILASYLDRCIVALSKESNNGYYQIYSNQYEVAMIFHRENDHVFHVITVLPHKRNKVRPDTPLLFVENTSIQIDKCIYID